MKRVFLTPNIHRSVIDFVARRSCICNNQLFQHWRQSDILYVLNSSVLVELSLSCLNSIHFIIDSYTEDLFRPGMETTVLEIIEAEKHVVFAPACYRHGIMTKDLWTNVSVSGVTAQSQLLGLISGNGSQDVVSTCQGVNCQDTCPELEIGENSYCWRINIHNRNKK